MADEEVSKPAMKNTKDCAIISSMVKVYFLSSYMVWSISSTFRLFFMSIKSWRKSLRLKLLRSRFKTTSLTILLKNASTSLAKVVRPEAEDCC